MSDIRYYHGTKRSMAAPFAHKDKFTFWVYPSRQQTKPPNPWDTTIEASDYCNNHVDEGKSPDAPELRQYICLGHSNIEDMTIVTSDWLNRGLRTKIEHEVVIPNDVRAVTKRFYHGCNIPREFPNGDNHFYYSPPPKNEPYKSTNIKWHTHRPPHEYCSNNKEVSVDKTRPGVPHGISGFRQFVCNGHDSENDLWAANSGERYANRPRPNIHDLSVAVMNIEPLKSAVHTRFVSLDEQIYELEKVLERTVAQKQALERETAELKLLVNKSIDRIYILELENKKNQEKPSYLLAENADLKSTLEKAILRLDSLEQAPKKDRLDKAISSMDLSETEQVAELTNNSTYIYLLPLLVVLFMALLATTHNFPVITTAQYPQITADID